MKHQSMRQLFFIPASSEPRGHACIEVFDFITNYVPVIGELILEGKKSLQNLSSEIVLNAEKQGEIKEKAIGY